MSGFTKTNTNTNTNTLLESATISFHQNSGIIPNDVHIFGMIELKAATLTQVITKNLEVYLNIDVSGSMEESCKDGKSKMHHIRHIIRNLLKELYKFKETNIAVIIKGFESHVHNILNIENLLSLSDEELANEVIPKIDKLVPLSLTNIEKALKHVSKYMDKDMDKDMKEEQINKEVKKMHILLTDGNATDGETNPNCLKKLMPSPNRCTNVTLGLGTDYDARALRIISDNNFKHINEAETAGFCVGEIIHSFLYEALKDVKITIQNGVIFDYQTNTWSTELNIPSIASEQTKNYTIMSPNPDAVIVTISCIMNGIPFEHIISENVKTDLTKYQFRQEVMELLYNASELEKSRHELDKLNYDDLDLNYICQDLKEDLKRSPLKQAQKDMKTQLKQQLLRMLRYMDQNNLNGDAFYKTLCMDIKVSLDSIGRKNAELYITSRITSQGRQETYTCDTIEQEQDQDQDQDQVQYQKPFKFTRQTNAQTYGYEDRDEDLEALADGLEEETIEEETIKEEEIEEEIEEDNKLLSRFNASIQQQDNLTINSPYSSPQKAGLMRGVSCQPDEKEEEEEE